ncbi:MAG: hypothetical protein ACT4QD_12260 [Acidobacteriota bacterium]
MSHAAYLECVAEDGHITFRFARNLAEGHGFVWNVGERAVEGFTSFLWVLVAAFSFTIVVDPLRLTQGLGMLSGVGTLWLTFVTARRRMGASHWIAVVPCLLLAVSGPFATWALSGMEITTFGFFALLGVFAYLTHMDQASLRWLVVSGLSLSTATLLRPEGLLFFVVLLGLAVTVLWHRTRPALPPHLVWAMTYGLPLVVFLVWRLQVFGDPLPNTFYQKVVGGFWQHARGAGYLINFSFYYLLPLAPFPALLAWEVGLPTLSQLRQRAFAVRLLNDHPAVAVCGSLTIAWFAAMVYVGGDYMAMYRFMVPVVPLIYLLLVPIVQSLYSSALAEPRKLVLLAMTVLLAAVATAFHSTPLESSFFRVATWQHGNYRGVQAERRYVRRFELIGRFFEDYRKSDTESLATRSIGAIGYHARHLAIHDLSGLTDRHIARVPARATNRGWAGHEKWDLDYSFHRLPTYFMLDENLTAKDIPLSARETAPEMAAAIVAAFPTARRFADWIRDNAAFIEQNYRLETVWMSDAGNGEAGYLAFLERRSSPTRSTDPGTREGGVSQTR